MLAYSILSAFVLPRWFWLVVGGRPAGVELSDHADTCRRLLPKLIRSYAIDAPSGHEQGARVAVGDTRH